MCVSVERLTLVASNAGPTLLTKYCGRRTQENKQQTETHKTETHHLRPNRRSVLLTDFTLHMGILPLKQRC